MLLRTSSALLAASTTVALWISASAAQEPQTIDRLKALQQEALLREPAERVESLESARESQIEARGSVGNRLRRPPVEGTDLGSPSPPVLGTKQSIQSLPANHRINDRDNEPWGACQSEVSIAAYDSKLVAAWNDGIGIYGPPTSPTDDTQGFGYSTDGGLTWTDGGPVPNGGNFIWASDPIVVVNEKTGAFYYCALFDKFDVGINGIAIVKGTFSGNTFSWGTPVVVRSVPYISTLLDKPWMAVDSLSGNLYVTFTSFAIVNGQLISDAIQFARSTDDGQSWSLPITLSASSDAGLVQGSRPAVGPDGEIHCVWYAIGQSFGPNANSAYGRDFFRVRKSTNGGVSFGAQVTADSVFSNFGSGAPGFNRGFGLTFPAIAVDRSAGPTRGRVHLAWNESLNFYDDPLPVVGVDPARQEIENNNAPFSATFFTPGEILRGGISTTGNPGDLDYWKWNATQGQTVIFYLDSLRSSLDASFRIFCSDGATLLAFSQNGIGGQDLLVFTAPTTATYFARVASYQGFGTGGYRILTTVNTPQADRARDQRDIFVKSSGDGTIWGPTARVNDDPGYFDDWLPEVTVDDHGRVFVADYDWRDSPELCGGGSNVYLYRSVSDGVWAAGERLSDVTTNWTTTYSTLIPNQGDYIAMFARPGAVHVAWGDGRETDPDVYTTSVPIGGGELTADAGEDTTVECRGPSGTAVRLDGTGSSGAATYLWSAPNVTFDDPASPTPTGSFPLGITTVTLVVGNGTATAQDAVLVTVVDTTPPQLQLQIQPSQLWPPNGELATIQAEVQASDACDASTDVRLVSIQSDEPDAGTGDIQGADFGTADFEFQLRAEREGGGDGRTYTVCYEGRDDSGNSRQQCVAVTVPHDRSARASLERAPETNRLILFGDVIAPASAIDAASVEIGTRDFRRVVPTDHRSIEIVDYDGNGQMDLVVSFQDDAQSSLLLDSARLFARWTAAGLASIAELTIERPVGVRDEPSPVFLARVGGNPTSDSPLIRFALPRAGRVRLDLFDVTGKRVARLIDRVLDAGWHDARYRDAQALTSQLLLYRLEWEGRVLTGKIVVVH